MQTVRIPAGPDPGVVAHPSERVLLERVVEQVEPSRFELERAGRVELDCEGGSARAVLAVTPVGLAARVVQEPEQEHELGVDARLAGCQVEPGRRDRVPVAFAVQVRVSAPCCGEDAIDEGDVRDGHGSGRTVEQGAAPTMI
jgi:hypothetical protein